MIDLRDTDSNSYLTFRIGTELFGASVSHVISILEMTKITRVPKAPMHMRGVINLRGSVLPVLDTRIKFGVKDTSYTNNTCILVLDVSIKNESIRMGAIVDAVQEVLTLIDEEIQPPPKLGQGFQAELITGMAKKEEEFIMLLDIERLFSEEVALDIKSSHEE